MVALLQSAVSRTVPKTPHQTFWYPPTPEVITLDTTIPEPIEAPECCPECKDLGAFWLGCGGALVPDEYKEFFSKGEINLALYNRTYLMSTAEIREDMVRVMVLMAQIWNSLSPSLRGDLGLYSHKGVSLPR